MTGDDDRAPHADDGGWQRPKQRRAKPRVHAHSHTAPHAPATSATTIASRVNELRSESEWFNTLPDAERRSLTQRHIDAIYNDRALIQSARICDLLIARLRQSISTIDADLLCLGVGRVSQSRDSRLQLALASVVQSQLSLTGRALYYDPLCSDYDISIVTAMGFNVIDRNTEGRYSVSDCVTVVLAPHCTVRLSDHLLQSNWSNNLANLILIANSFSTIVESQHTGGRSDRHQSRNRGRRRKQSASDESSEWRCSVHSAPPALDETNSSSDGSETSERPHCGLGAVCCAMTLGIVNVTELSSALSADAQPDQYRAFHSLAVHSFDWSNDCSSEAVQSLRERWRGMSAGVWQRLSAAVGAIEAKDCELVGSEHVP